MWYIGQSITALDHAGCILKWSPSSADDLEGYSVYMKEGETGEFKKATSRLIEEPEWQSPPLRLDMKYYFYITATDRSSNESLPSSVVAFQLKDATPDPTVIVLERPRTFRLAAAASFSDKIKTNDFFTRFELGGNA